MVTWSIYRPMWKRNNTSIHTIHNRLQRQTRKLSRGNRRKTRRNTRPSRRTSKKTRKRNQRMFIRLWRRHIFGERRFNIIKYKHKNLQLEMHTIIQNNRKPNTQNISIDRNRKSTTQRVTLRTMAKGNDVLRVLYNTIWSNS